jgi:DNA repair exonuclease SbcCD ATPase subunit
MKIVKLLAENFKRIKAIEIEPNGNTVLITGKNGQGKSSILDSIVSALCGKKYCPDKPIRDGEDHAEVVIETENYIIKRTFTEAGGGAVTITNADGMKASSPQKLLDKIVGQIAFDPMEFINLGETERGRKDQRDKLMELVGLNFSDIDEKINAIKSERSDIRRDKERYEHEAERIVIPEDTPDEPVSVAELSQQLQKATESNAKFSEYERETGRLTSLYADTKRDYDVTAKQIENLKAELSRAEVSLKRLEATLTEINQADEENRNAQKAFVKVDTEAIQAKIANAESINDQIRLKKQKAELQEQVEAKAEEWRAKGQEIKELEAEKAKRLSEAKMPLPGLSVSDDCVMSGNVPLSQENDAKKLEIGMAIAMAENPKLRVILMKGNDLDEDSLKAISKLADEKDYMVWIERIEGEGGIVIEDGSIKV